MQEDKAGGSTNGGRPKYDGQKQQDQPVSGVPDVTCTCCGKSFFLCSCTFCSECGNCKSCNKCTC